MPDWKRIVKNISEAIEAAAREAGAQQRTRQVRAGISRNVYQPRECLFWDCDVPIRPDHVFCYDHFQDLQDGLIDECPGCSRAKYAQYDVCLDCYRNPPPHLPRVKAAPSPGPKYQWYRPEYSEAWEKGDATADQFFVYILKLDNGEFYPGQTRELRERLSEHRDGKVQSTAGQNPKLVWFGTLPTRDAATAMEVELKKLVQSNPREIRRMVIRFRDLVRELEDA
ncbi:MAG: GIY-YIG nuclease family protein [Dehalococcoidia bacterium]